MQGSVVFIGLRHLRAPLVTLIAVFSIGIAGLVLIPGTLENGERWTLTFAEAFYFMSYTATTIGFGEIPRAFSDTQRLWVTLMIYASVVGWAYLIAALLALARDAAFRGAIEEAAFARSIRGLREPFYLICGFGETGACIGRALDALDRRFVVIDLDPRRIEELDLMDLRQAPPALCADVRVPAHLIEAGLQSPNCIGVLALTESDQANLAVAMAVRLLNPDVPVIARAMPPGVARNMASFGTDHIIDPFSRFGAFLELALSAPATHRLVSWLTTPSDQPVASAARPPRGHWLVVGYGRFGRAVTQALRAQGHDVTVVDPDETSLPGVRAITGTGTEPEPLLAGGIMQCVGVVAGTEDDITNLSVAVTARELNDTLFTVVRQNLEANEALFRALAPDMVMMPSRIIADACLAQLRAPHLETFLTGARTQGDAWASTVLAQLDAMLGSRAPTLWSVALTASASPALHAALCAGGAVPLDRLLASPRNRDQALTAVALGLVRAGEFYLLPNAVVPDPIAHPITLAPGDEILFAGTDDAMRLQMNIRENARVCAYVVFNETRPATWLGQLLERWSGRSISGPSTDSTDS